MTNSSVFEYSDYKDYLKNWIAARPNNGHGEKSKIAKKLKCHIAYLTQVLRGSADLSLEQASALNEYLGHSDDEAEFLLLLVLQNRSGTKPLKEFFQKKMNLLIERRMVLKNRLSFKGALSEESQAIYYSAWYFIAIHILLTIPQYQSRAALEKRLAIPAKTLSQAIEFLEATGLIEQDAEGRLKTTVSTLHLGNDSLMISRHHINWRVRAIAALEGEQKDELHYSSVVSISKDDALKIKKQLIAAIEEVRKTVRNSPEEELFCYSLDLFKV